MYHRAAAACKTQLDTLRREALADMESAHARVETVRLKLLQIGARVVRSARRIAIHLAEGYSLQDLFARTLGRLRSLVVPSRAPLHV